MKYLIDTNCFIEANNRFLPIDVASSFWNLVKELAENGDTESINFVKNEINGHIDQLSRWVNTELPDGYFRNLTDAEMTSYGDVVNWATNSTVYSDRAKQKFLRSDKSDIYLVSISKLDPENIVVVSMEANAPISPGEIKLPAACRHYGVRCITFSQMLREMWKTF